MAAISDAEKATIEQEAQQILKKFSAALAKVKIPKRAEQQNREGWREEEQSSTSNKDFRERMFANAPHHDANAIIAEKKTWS